jgi:phosphotransferase system HPr-like phosphotransfer protein
LGAPREGRGPAAGKGIGLRITADGEDELQAIEELEALFQDRFGEEN